MKMTPNDWERAKELFEAALELDPSRRASFLTANCHEQGLQREVEQLLIDYQAAGSFLDKPALHSTGKSAETEDPMVNRRLGAYKLVRRLGQGGMAAVFLAVRADDEYQKEVAVKLVQPGLDSQDVMTRFRNERQTLAGLDHPNIVRLLDGGSTPEGWPFLIMEYVEGRPIDAYCDEHKLSVENRLRLFGEVCDAVQYAHEKLVIHRDLKPSNILVMRDGTPKLLDFGIAKVLNPEPSTHGWLATQTGVWCMTPAYASPEQARGKSVTTETDVYSLGVVLYELLTGHRPYQLTQHSPAEIERAICEQEPETPSKAINRVENDTSPDGKSFTKTPELVSLTREGEPDKLRRRLRGDLDIIVLKALQKEPLHRYGSVAKFSQDIDRHLQHQPVKARPTTLAYRVSKFVQRHKTEVSAAFAVLIVVAAAASLVFGWLFHARKAHTLTDEDTILLADFTNYTGDAVFDGTLRQGLSVQLEQSPFLSIISDEKIQQTLRMMGQKPDVKLTAQIARELCQRVGSKAMLTSSIAQIGTQYTLILKVNSCANGELLASTGAQASDKSHVLDALGSAASQIRNKLGESLSTVQKLATPLDQATTPSLEALQAYTLGRNQAVRGAPANAVPFLKRAIELDPNFALAYAGLSILYSHTELGPYYATKAYELRDHVSERERLYITAVYYEEVTGELDKTIETLKIMEQTYPRDDWAHVRLGAAYERAGELAQAAEEYRITISLNPQRVRAPEHLGAVLLRLGRLDEAKAIFEEVIGRKDDDIDVHLGLYRIAYVRGDATGMQREVEWAAGKPDEFLMVWEQGVLALGEGKRERAVELLRRADDLAAQRNLNREVASATTRLAAYSALVGDCQGVREHVASAAAVSLKLPVRFATPLAFCGYTRQAQELIEDMRARFPKDTLIQAVRIPVASAAIAIHDGNPEAAIESLRSAVPYENGYPGPIYLRGLAYLQANKSAEAATEFQKIVRRADVFTVEPVQALAHIQLGRAYALQGDTAKARGAYQDFFTLWKDADPDIPILKQAKAEYSKLK